MGRAVADVRIRFEGGDDAADGTRGQWWLEGVGAYAHELRRRVVVAERSDVFVVGVLVRWILERVRDEAVIVVVRVAVVLFFVLWRIAWPSGLLLQYWVGSSAIKCVDSVFAVGMLCVRAAVVAGG